MKSFFRLFIFVAGAAFALAACNKVADLPHYEHGNAPTLTASATTIAPLPADSNNVALTLSWTSPKYATDTANYKYTIEIDTTGKNFANPYTKVVMGSKSATFTAKELNNMLLA